MLVTRVFAFVFPALPARDQLDAIGTFQHCAAEVWVAGFVVLLEPDRAFVAESRWAVMLINGRSFAKAETDRQHSGHSR